MEDYAYVIEYMPSGRSADMRKEPIVQLLGAQGFTLLEASVRSDANIVIGQKIFVGKGERSEIERIRKRINYEELSTSAKDVLPVILKKMIEERSVDFIAFINRARPISMRVHTLDLLPGLGKKSMETLLAEREKKPFESFEDVKARVPTIVDPSGIFAHRILSEIEGLEKHYLFVRPPAGLQDIGRR
ncbi:TPA: DUF655 domain-containing protein [Candidatus Micrarchaeota archaeon]|nr:DUF655 domain-containing protein [Candidatus Micrarchaeota archaeon]